VTELAHEMVSSALEQQDDTSSKPKVLQPKVTKPNNLQDLIAEQRAYRRVGFTSEVFELQTAINEKKKDKSNDKSAEDEKLVKQRLTAMEMRQRKRSDELHQSHQQEMDTLIQTQMTDYQNLLEKQANEMHQLVENVTAMMTIGSGWTPSASAPEGGVVPWAMQLKKHRFRPSRELASLIENVKKLSELHSNATMLIELQQKAEALEKRERDVWRKNTMRQVLGNDRGSLASQMVAAHKVAQEKLKDHHKQKQRILEKTQQAAVTVLEGQFRLERLNVIEGVKQRRKREALRESEEAMDTSSFNSKLKQSKKGSLDYMAANILGQNEARDMMIDDKGRSTLIRHDGTIWQAPKNFGLEAARDEKWVTHKVEDNDNVILDPVETLLRVRWLDPSAEALRAIIRPDAGRKQFELFLTDIDKRAKVSLTHWQQIKDCMSIRDPWARASEAIRLHEVHRALGAGAQAVRVDSTEALQLLEQKAERILAKLQEQWLGPFLQANYGRRVIRMSRGNPEFAALPIVEEDDDWAAMLSEAVAKVPHAVIVVDMLEPGTPLVGANEMFEKLTLFERDSIIGTNCRFLQGPLTEQEEVAKIVKSMRDAEELTVKLTNYKQDGTTFSNWLTLLPVRDVNGLYCYSVALMADVATLTESTRVELARLRELLPRQCSVSRERKVPDVDFARVSDAVRKDRSLDKLVCLTNVQRCLGAILDDADALDALKDHLESSRTASNQLEMILDVRELSMRPLVMRSEQAADVAANHLPEGTWDADDPEELVHQLQAAAGAAMRSIAEQHIATFIASSASDAVVKRLQLGLDFSAAGCSHLLWEKYRVPPDCAAWLFGLVTVLDKMPECVTITDARQAGNPLIYVNQSFCKTVGYSKSEVLGRNCRFLQGPETEVNAVAAISHAIRHGEDCFVRITNYRRNGQQFKNFLLMRSMTDAGGTTRYFVGVQKELTGSPRDAVTTTILSQLIPSLYVDPNAPPAPQGKSGATPMQIAENSARNAITGAIPSGGAEDIRGAARFSQEHARMRKAAGGVRDWAAVAAILWLCAETSEELATEFAKQLIVGEGVEDFRKMLVEKVPKITTDRQLQSAFDQSTSPDEKAERLAPVVAEYIGLFLEAPDGQRFLSKLFHADLEAFDEDSHLRKHATWLEMLEQATDKLPFAVVMVDMQEPGTRIVLANDAFERLTGYEKEFAIGRNCRFLQGELTEQEDLTSLVWAIRHAKPAQVELTNYKEDGTSFRNHLSIRPIHDSNGMYRFCIAMLADVAQLSAVQRERKERAARLLPARFEASSLPLKEPPTKAPDLADVPNLSKLYWLHDLEASMRTLLDDPDALDTFKDYLAADEDGLEKLGFVVAVRDVQSQPFEVQEDRAHELASSHLDPGAWEGSEIERLLEQLADASDEAIRTIAMRHMPSFVQSSASDAIVDRLELGCERPFGSSLHLLWDAYVVPPECAGWLYAVVSAAESLPECFTISDCRIPGNPLIYVNDAFCKTVGYSKSEILGRNCRFLQGPETELEAIVEIVSAIRRGQDCSVTLTNYKRSGGKFLNRLKMRAVVDSDEVARFFLGVQYDASAGGQSCEHSAQRAAVVLDLIPVALDHLEPLEEEAIPPAPDEEGAPDFSSHVRFVREHTLMLKAVGAFDPTNPFTRMLWFADRSETLKALLPCQAFVSCFQDFLSECFSSFLSDWETACAISNLSSIAPKQRDEYMRTVYEKLVGEPATGKSALLLRQTLDKEGAKLQERILSEVFPAFLEHPLCTTMLQILAKEEEMGGTMPAGLEFVERQSWLEMFSYAIEKLPQAIIITDMHSPGAKIIGVNAAFVNLTGYEKDFVVGRNCRFLQGAGTEPDAVLRIIHSLRKPEGAQHEITNYKEDGTSFRNLLSLQPVYDSLDVYRFSIGIIADAEETTDVQRGELERLRRLLPSHFEEELQPVGLRTHGDTGRTEDSGKAGGGEVRRATEQEFYANSMLEDFGVLAWLRDAEGSISLMARDEDALASLRDNLPSLAAKQSLDLWMEACEVEILFDDESREELSKQILTKFFGFYELGEGQTYPDVLQRESEAAFADLLQIH